MSRPGEAGAWLLSLLLAVTAVGCGSVTPTRHYMLEWPTTARDARAVDASGLRIGVQEFHVDPPYDGERIVYRMGEDSSEIGFYGYHHWAAPLPRLLAVAASEALRDLPGIGHVEPWRAGERYDARLEGRVYELQEVDGAARILARVGLELRLRGPDGDELWSLEVHEHEPVPTREVAAVVEALNRGVERALRRARDDLSRALTSRAE